MGDVLVTILIFSTVVTAVSPAIYSISSSGRLEFLVFPNHDFLKSIVGGLEEVESAITLYAPVPFEGSFPEVPMGVYFYSSCFTLIWSFVFAMVKEKWPRFFGQIFRSA
jgi:hypothetical protein